ncbi:MAG: chromosome partitioning protein ParB [Nodularia sp. (in: Bacteria)]|nr:MAG: chromosome partitioning protein ParB [Nodularia sp. (in: cyanobacteria)]
MTNFLMVDVAGVTSSVPRSNFSEADLNILADKILESGGLLKPLVLKKTGFEKYEVIDGHFEYYAAVKAREKNSDEGEMVNSLIISSEKEEAVLKQAIILKSVDSANKLVNNITETTSPNSPNIAIYNLNILEKQIQELRSEIVQERQERQKLYDTIKLLENQIPKQITPLEAFNTLGLIDLTFRLRTAGFTDKKAVSIAESVDKERKDKKFESLKDVMERVKVTSGKKQIKGISGDKMVDIVDSWSRILFI